MDSCTCCCECPFCDHSRLQARISALQQAMPLAVYERMVALLLRPLLLSISQLFPVTFPSAWITNPPCTLDKFPTGDEDLRSPRLLFMEMCARVAGGATTDVSGLVKRIVLCGNFFYFRVLDRRRPRIGGMREIDLIRVRLDAIHYPDIIFRRLRDVVVSITSDRICYTQAMCNFASEVGMVKHMRQLAERFRAKCKYWRRIEYLDRLIAELDAMLAHEHSTKIAIAMALHVRLGSAAGLAALGPDLLPMCIPVVRPIGSWAEL